MSEDEVAVVNGIAVVAILHESGRECQRLLGKEARPRVVTRLVERPSGELRVVELPSRGRRARRRLLPHSQRFVGLTPSLVVTGKRLKNLGVVGLELPGSLEKCPYEHAVSVEESRRVLEDLGAVGELIEFLGPETLTQLEAFGIAWMGSGARGDGRLGRHVLE